MFNLDIYPCWVLTHSHWLKHLYNCLNLCETGMVWFLFSGNIHVLHEVCLQTCQQTHNERATSKASTVFCSRSPRAGGSQPGPTAQRRGGGDIILWNTSFLWSECRNSRLSHAKMFWGSSNLEGTVQFWGGQMWPLENTGFSIHGLSLAKPQNVADGFHIPRNTLSSWWFGTFFFSPYIANVILPIDEFIFFRGIGQQPTSKPLKIFHDLTHTGDPFALW